MLLWESCVRGVAKLGVALAVGRAEGAHLQRAAQEHARQWPRDHPIWLLLQLRGRL